jgi:hypothetical protein
MLAAPVVAPVVHPDVTAEGWAFARTENGWVYGRAYLWVTWQFMHPPLDEDGEPVIVPVVQLEVCDYLFYWTFDEDSVVACRNVVKITANPCHANEETAPGWNPVPIRLIQYHKEPWWVVLYGRGIFFMGKAIC